MKHYTVGINFRVIVTAIAASLSLSSISSARKVEIWPYEKLLKEADLVVIACAVTFDEMISYDLIAKLFRYWAESQNTFLATCSLAAAAHAAGVSGE